MISKTWQTSKLNWRNGSGPKYKIQQRPVFRELTSLNRRSKKSGHLDVATKLLAFHLRPYPRLSCKGAKVQHLALPSFWSFRSARPKFRAVGRTRDMSNWARKWYRLWSMTRPWRSIDLAIHDGKQTRQIPAQGDFAGGSWGELATQPPQYESTLCFESIYKNRSLPIYLELSVICGIINTKAQDLEVKPGSMAAVPG